MQAINPLDRIQNMLSYNWDKITIPEPCKPNIVIGIGLWSAQNGLSNGLPVDVMQMLLAATVLRSQIVEKDPKLSSKVIVLIADSMAETEGADADQVKKIVAIYKDSLKPMLALLNLENYAEIRLTSDIEKEEKCREIREKVVSSSTISEVIDEKHENYVYSQTALIQYMNLYENVGVKVGWIRDPEKKGKINWDEEKFDDIYRSIFESSTLQCLYGKAGIKCTPGRYIEGTPYTAYTEGKRWVIRTDGEIVKKIKTNKPENKHWKGIAEICNALKDLKIVSSEILPEGCINPNNEKATINNMLKHWINRPLNLKAGKEG